MCLVDDDGVVLLEVSMALHGVQQNAVGHDLDASFGAHFVGEANLITDQPAQLYFEFFCNALGYSARGDAPRLSMGDAVAAQLETHFRNLGGFTRAGGTGNDDDLMIANRIQNLISASANRQISRVGDV